MRRAALAGSLLLLTGLLAVPATATGTPSMVPMDKAVRRAAGAVSVLVHARPGHLAGALTTARSAGLSVGSVYESIEVFAAYGPATTFRALAGGDLSYLEANHLLSYSTETSHQATRGQNVLDKEVTLPNGGRIDGTGVGIAIVDSGIDGTHPDLADHIGGNVKTVCSTPQFVATGATGFTTCLGPKAYVPVADSDTVSAGGHGTHVSGIAAGDGTASSGRFHGAAPGATLYGVSVGTTISVENGLDGLEWVLENHDLVTPKIKVVNNSWGGDHADYDPENDPFSSALWKLQEDLVADGVTVVFAAGNAGGNGNTATTAAECVNPTPGVICVANYDDKNTGTRGRNHLVVVIARQERQARELPGHLGSRDEHHLHLPGNASGVLDGRGPGSVRQPLRQHVRNLDGRAAHHRHRGPAVPGEPLADAGPGRERARGHRVEELRHGPVRGRSVQLGQHDVVRPGPRPGGRAGRRKGPLRTNSSEDLAAYRRSSRSRKYLESRSSNLRSEKPV